MNLRLPRTVLLALAFAIGLLGTVLPTQQARALTPSDFFALTAKAAQTGERAHDVPTSVSLAQAALESGWGESILATEGNAYFGIKCKTDNGPYATGCMDKKTTECNSSGCFPVVASFRIYDSMQDSFADHGHFLASRSHYAAAFSTTNPDDFIRAVHKGGYATDPGYADKIINLMVKYDLYRYDLGEDMPTLEPGDEGEAVKTAQRELQRHGYDIGTSGVFGPVTEATVRTFKADQGLGINSIIGPVTWAELFGPVSLYRTIAEGDTGPSVTEAQRLLQRHGYDIGLSGVFGPKTAATVRAFKADQGLGINSIIGPVTWAALRKV